MAFDWLSFFMSHRVDYSDSGANVSADNVVVHCPFCGNRDPSQHMSVNLSGKGWRCFRDQTHRGKNPARLVAALAGLPIDRANALVGNATFIPSDYEERLKMILHPEVAQDRRGLTLPKEFKPFGRDLPSERPYRNYLVGRGFTRDQVNRMTWDYGVHYCGSGSFGGRIIFPVYHRKKLVSWTGRAISPKAELRYRALGRDGERTRAEGYEPALGAISHYLLWYNKLRLSDADTLVLCEGPFDSLKVNVLGERHGIVSTCFFTAAPTREQLLLLHDLVPRFKRAFVLLDQHDTLATSISVTNDLASLGVRSSRLPRSLKDPGDFSDSSFRNFLLTMR